MPKPLTVWITINCGNFLRNLQAGLEAIVRTGHGTTTGSKSGQEYIKAVYCHPVYLTCMQSTSCKMPGWFKHKLESRFPGGISKPQIWRWHHPYGRKQRRTKEFLDEGERGEWKSWLQTQHSDNKDHGIWFHHFMANSWGNNGNSDRLYFLGLQNHCKDITLLTKVHLVKSMVFLVVMYGCSVGL